MDGIKSDRGSPWFTGNRDPCKKISDRRTVQDHAGMMVSVQIVTAQYTPIRNLALRASKLVSQADCS